MSRARCKDALHIAGVQAEAGVVGRQIEPAQSNLRRGAEPLPDSGEQLHRFRQAVRSKEGGSYDYLEDETSSRQGIVHATNIAVFERHSRSCAATLEGKVQPGQPQLCGTRLVGERLPLLDFVSDGLRHSELERHDQSVDAFSDAANLGDQRWSNDHRPRRLQCLGVAFGGG